MRQKSLTYFFILIPEKRKECGIHEGGRKYDFLQDRS